MNSLTRIVLAACVVVGTTVLADADDRLVLVGASYGKNVLAICETDGTVIWSHDTAGPQKGHAGHHDVHLLPNGNILFHDSWTKTQEITLGKEVVWEYDSATMNGNEGKKVDVHAFDRLSNGETVIVESSVGRIIHVDKDGKLVKQVPLGEGGRKKTRLMRILDNGHYLACAENPWGRVRIRCRRKRGLGIRDRHPSVRRDSAAERQYTDLFWQRKQRR